jgi:hypothetical protein
MKLSKHTLATLRWCSRVGDRVRISPNGLIQSRSLSSTNPSVFYAQIDEKFPFDCCIVSVKGLLRLLDDRTVISFPNPETMELRKGRGRISLQLASPGQSISDRNEPYTPSPRSMPTPYPESIFLHHEDVQNILRLKLCNGRVELRSESSTSNAWIACYETEAEGPISYEFTPRIPFLWNHHSTVIFKQKDLKLMPGSYKIGFSEQGYASFRWLHSATFLFIPFGTPSVASIPGQQVTESGASAVAVTIVDS